MIIMIKKWRATRGAGFESRSQRIVVRDRKLDCASRESWIFIPYEKGIIHFGWKTKKSPKKGVRLNLGIIAAIYVKLRDEVIRVKDLVTKEKGQCYLKERIPVKASIG